MRFEGFSFGSIWPYAFYTLLRLVVCGCSIYLAVKANSTRNIAWTWIMSGMAVLFNPILPIRLHRSDWQIVDALAAVTLFVFVAVYKPGEERDPGQLNGRIN